VNKHIPVFYKRILFQYSYKNTFNSIAVFCRQKVASQHYFILFYWFNKFTVQQGDPLG